MRHLLKLVAREKKRNDPREKEEKGQRINYEVALILLECWQCRKLPKEPSANCCCWEKEGQYKGPPEIQVDLALYGKLKSSFLWVVCVYVPVCRWDLMSCREIEIVADVLKIVDVNTLTEKLVLLVLYWYYCKQFCGEKSLIDWHFHLYTFTLTFCR